MGLSELHNVIGGKSAAAADGQTSEVIDPTTGEVYATAPVSGAADVDRAFDAAAKGFEVWRDATPSERQLALFRFADAIETRADELVDVECKNTGKPVALTMSEEIPPMIDQIRFFAGAARNLEGRVSGEYMKGMTSMIRREPVGICAQVTPWNYPMMMAVWKFAPAIAAGNAIVLKPSDTTPASTVLMAEIAAEFFPPGVFNVDLRRPRHRSRLGGPQGAGDGLDHRQRPGRPRGRRRPRRPTSSGCTSSSAARRRASSSTTPTSRRRRRGSPSRVTSTPGQDCTASTRVLAGPKVHNDFLDALDRAGRRARPSVASTSRPTSARSTTPISWSG